MSPYPLPPRQVPLSGEQQEIWLAYMRVMLRLNYEMNRQLQADSDLSLADYDVLNALADSPGVRLALTVLAARIGWERSRVSHHVRLLPPVHRALSQIHEQVLAAGTLPRPVEQHRLPGQQDPSGSDGGPS